jgi:hypothetical protein
MPERVVEHNSHLIGDIYFHTMSKIIKWKKEIRT